MLFPVLTVYFITLTYIECVTQLANLGLCSSQLLFIDLSHGQGLQRKAHFL